MKIETIGVCGAGTMGSGIAQVAAQSGFPTILFEPNSEVLTKAKTSIEKNLAPLVDKGKITAKFREDTIGRIHFTSNIRDCRADLIIEAIIERQEAKTGLFDQLAEFNSDETLLASNTSSLSISDIASRVKDPKRLIGMHFFNPATVMKLVEVVKTDHTTAEIIQAICELARRMNKTPVVCKDSPGFIVNRVARPYYIESLRLIEEGLTGVEQIDSLMEATGFKMGPFRLMDLIGNDVNYAVSCSVYEQLHKPERLKPSPIQEEKVEKGEWGRKSGKGYYQY